MTYITSRRRDAHSTVNEMSLKQQQNQLIYPHLHAMCYREQSCFHTKKALITTAYV